MINYRELYIRLLRYLIKEDKTNGKINTFEEKYMTSSIMDDVFKDVLEEFLNEEFTRFGWFELSKCELGFEITSLEELSIKLTLLGY